MSGRKKRTVGEYVDRILATKAATTAGVVRRKRSTIPAHITLPDLIAEVTRRAYKLLIGEDQIIIVTDRRLLICN